jgi:hypothetical protein
MTTTAHSAMPRARHSGHLRLSGLPLEERMPAARELAQRALSRADPARAAALREAGAELLVVTAMLVPEWPPPPPLAALAATHEVLSGLCFHLAGLYEVHAAAGRAELGAAAAGVAAAIAALEQELSRTLAAAALQEAHCRGLAALPGRKEAA